MHLTADQLRHALMTTHTRPRQVDRETATAVPLPVKVGLPDGTVVGVASAGVEDVGGEKSARAWPRATETSHMRGLRHE
jgi:hypothetical protein